MPEEKRNIRYDRFTVTTEDAFSFDVGEIENSERDESDVSPDGMISDDDDLYEQD